MLKDIEKSIRYVICFTIGLSIIASTIFLVCVYLLATTTAIVIKPISFAFWFLVAVCYHVLWLLIWCYCCCCCWWCQWLILKNLMCKNGARNIQTKRNKTFTHSFTHSHSFAVKQKCAKLPHAIYRVNKIYIHHLRHTHTSHSYCSCSFIHLIKVIYGLWVCAQFDSIKRKKNISK